MLYCNVNHKKKHLKHKAFKLKLKNYIMRFKD